MHNETLARAFQFFGFDKQLDKQVEECGELITAIMKFKLNPSKETFEHVCEEMADVQIMLDQFQLDHNTQSITGKIREQKIQRLERLLNELQR